MDTIVNNGCEMVTSYLVNPARGDEWWSPSQINNYVPPQGYELAEPNDWIVMWPVNGMNFETTGYGIMFQIKNPVTGVVEDNFQVRSYNSTFHWCKSGDITSMQIWNNGRSPSWNFRKNTIPQGTTNTYCKTRLVKSHAPKISLSNLSETHINSMTIATRDYLLGTTTVEIPKLPTLVQGMNENIQIDPYFIGLSAWEIRDMIQKEQNISISMIWTQKDMVSIIWTSGRMEGTNPDHYHFEIGVEYKFLTQ